MTPFLEQHWPILTVGLGVSALAFLVGRGVLRGETPKTEEDEESLENLDLQSARDRRSDSRRKGNPVEVDLCDPKGRIDPFSGYVFDRSRGGICLTVQIEIPAGTILNACPRVRQNTYSIPLEVRSCRAVRDGFLLGCQFVQTPPWNVLILFG
jgi:hypothetical protein